MARYCEFYPNLYVGKRVRDPALVRQKLMSGAGQLNIFVLKAAETQGDQLDIIHCAFLKQPYYREHPQMIYGIASGYEEATELLVRIARDAGRAGYPGRLREFLDAAGEKERTDMPADSVPAREERARK